MRVCDLQRRAHEMAEEHGWWPDASPTDRWGRVPALLCLVHSEVSEALEDYRMGRIATVEDPSGKPCGLPSELADVVIRIADMAGGLGIDLEAEIGRKMAYNATREHRHGGKAC